MHKIEERLISNAFKERMGRSPPNLVPPDMRHDEVVSELAYAPLQQTEPSGTAKFIRLFKEHLHANANAQQRRSLFYSFANKLVEAKFGKCFHTCRERANTW